MKKESTNNSLPGVGCNSILRIIYAELLKGSVLTALDGIVKFRTMHFAKYIIILRLEHDVPIKSRWVELHSGKWCKEYYLEA